MPERRATGVVLAAAALGMLAQYLFVREGIGANMLVATAAFLGAAWRLRPRDARVHARDAWLPLSALTFAGLCAVRTDAPLVAFDITAAVCLSVVWSLSLRGLAVTDLRLAMLVREVARPVVAAAWRLAPAAALAAPALRRCAVARLGVARGYVAGVFLAVPLVALFATLFSSADAVFDHALRQVLDAEWLRELFAWLPARIAAAAVVAWTAGGVLAALADTVATAAPSGRRALGAHAATGLLVTVAIVFAAFVAIQVAYLFGGRDTLAEAGITYSAYARRGFFELVGATAVVAVLLFAVDLGVRTRTRAVVATALLLVALTAVVLASAAIRMDLYQRAYGWSELRSYATAAIVYLALALAILAWAIAASRMAVALQRLALAAVAVAVAVNAVGPSAFVARSNIARYHDPASLPADASRDLDVWYLMTLGEGAIPVVLEAVRSLPAGDRELVEFHVRVHELRHRPAPAWQSWNLDRERAREAVR